MNLDPVKIQILSDPKDHDFVESWYGLADKDHFWIQWRFAAFFDQLKSAGIPTNSTFKVLDIGCGNGILSEQIEKNTEWIVDGTDLSIEGLKANAPKRGDLYLYNISEKRPEFKEKYDIIFLFDILEHLTNVNEFIAAALFHLKPEGYCFINVPALPSLHSTYDKVVGHFRRYNKKMLSETFSSSNIQIINMRYWGFTLLLPLFLRTKLITDHMEKQKVINKGFMPPNKLVHSLLKTIMKIELFFNASFLPGTSLLAIIQKK